MGLLYNELFDQRMEVDYSDLPKIFEGELEQWLIDTAEFLEAIEQEIAS